jgi:outer membrane protein TolC
MRLSQVKAHTAEQLAIAALNEAIGINVSSPTEVVERALEPPFSLGLAESLRLAADNREEFGVVLRSVASAQLGAGVAKADFRPRILAGASGIHLDGANIQSSNLATVGLKVEWPLFQGGRRLGKLESAQADTRAAIAQGKQVCDTIAFEVQTAYLLIQDARQRIALARTAVSGASENLRVIRNLFEKGDATPTDVVDGELAMTRAQQDYYTALYDYQTALARLAYAVGLPVLSDFSATGGTCHE